MAIGVTFPENEDVVTFWWKIERLVRVESKVDIYKKELGNYAGYRLRKVYWKDLHYWGMKISRDAVTHVRGTCHVFYFLWFGDPFSLLLGEMIHGQRHWDEGIDWQNIYYSLNTNMYNINNNNLECKITGTRQVWDWPREVWGHWDR